MSEIFLDLPIHMLFDRVKSSGSLFYKDRARTVRLYTAVKLVGAVVFARTVELYVVAVLFLRRSSSGVGPATA